MHNMGVEQQVTVDAADDATMGWQKLVPGTPISIWAATEPSEKLFQGTPAALEDKVDYRFRNGWVETGDLPCRTALRAFLQDRRVPIPAGTFTELVLADDEGELDFSTFRYRATLISRAFRVRLRAVTEGAVRFRIQTCGGVRVWLGETEVAVFEPFIRNTRSEAEVEFKVPSGESTLTLRLEDLHERDTQNFFSFVFCGGLSLDYSLPQELAEPNVEAAAKTLDALRFDHVFYESGPIRLSSDHLPDERMNITIEGPVVFPRGDILGPLEAAPVSIHDIGRKVPGDIALSAESAVAGCVHLKMSAKVGAASMTRTTGTTILRQGLRLEGDLSQRKKAAADEIARCACFEPAVAMLLALRNEKANRVEEILASVLPTIEERHDCSDFSILPILRLWRDASATLSSDTQNRVKSAILGYRYWMTEPGNDVMWFWSENHVLCFHTAQLIAGKLFPDEEFTNSGCRGRQLAEDAFVHLNRWFDAIDAHGLCEWNSAAYYPIDMLGLLTLHDMAPELKDQSREVLDRLFAMVALHTSGDVPAGCQGRCYEKELLAGAATELGSVAAIALGRPFLAGYDRAAALFCVSSYETPGGLQAFSHPPPGTSLKAKYTQGFEQAGKLTLWKSADIQLSTSTSGNAGQKGHQAHVVDVQAAAHPMARLWINHPGELKEWGDRRPSLLAGNHVMPHVAQHDATAVLIYALDRPWTKLQFSQLFAVKDAFEPPKKLGDWWVFKAGDGESAVWCSAALAPVEGSYAGSLWRAHARRAAWVVTVKQPDEPSDAFAERLSAASPSFDDQHMTVETRASDATRLQTVFGGATTLNGTLKEDGPLSVEPHVGWNGGPLMHWRTHGARS